MIRQFDPSEDMGTPPIWPEYSSEYQEATKVELVIDGNPVSVPVGTSIMRAAKMTGAAIPKLCATDSVAAFGSCRVCLVEIEGKKGFPASCTTPVEAGMIVHTRTERLESLRKNVLELYISDHPLDCLTCASNGDCELQDMAAATGLREVRYGHEGKRHRYSEIDTSNPYFQFDSSKCIVCSRCVRACSEVQGTFALTVEGRGLDSKISASGMPDFLSSDCVSCGACVQACPTATLVERTLVESGPSERKEATTCAYCGVGCTFDVHLRGDRVVSMTPRKDGAANRGHSCVKGRFAFGYATHPDRVKTPMIRDHIDDAWREVSWDEALSFAAAKLRWVQEKFGRTSIGAITSSRCTNEETYLMQKLVRAGFGNNNVDTCARVCHSPTGYGLKQTLGESAGTQDFDSVEYADVIMVIGANPTDGHPVFGSRLKKRLRSGAKLIVVDPRAIDLVKSPHVEAAVHLPLLPGTNVALANALAHTIVSEGLQDDAFIQNRCDSSLYAEWLDFIIQPQNSPEALSAEMGVDAAEIRRAARLYAKADRAAIYYGLGVTEHSQGSTMVMGIANLAMLTGNIGRKGVGVNPLRGQNNVQGSCDMGSFPHELPGYQSVNDENVRARFEAAWACQLAAEPGFRIPNMFDQAIAGGFKALYCQGEDIAQSDPNTTHVEAALRAMECVIVQDIFMNETSRFAHVLLPGSSFLEKDGTFTNAERRISRVRKVIEPLAGKADWQVTQALANVLGLKMNYQHPSEIMAEIAALTPSFASVTYEKLDKGALQWPCNDSAPEGTPIMHEDTFTRGLGAFVVTEYVPTTEKVTRRFPLLLTTGRILSQYNVGAQTRRTQNNLWHQEDVLEIHSHDASERGIIDGMRVSIQSRAGETTLNARISERMQPGVVYTTFHHPDSGANVITTDNSDWATNCPEYKVTAVQVKPKLELSEWQKAREQSA